MVLVAVVVVDILGHLDLADGIDRYRSHLDSSFVGFAVVPLVADVLVAFGLDLLVDLELSCY